MCRARLHNAAASRIDALRLRLDRLTPRSPQDRINELAQRLDMLLRRMENSYKLQLSEAGRRLGELGGKLDALSPLKTLTRGYSIPIDDKGELLRKTADFAPGKEFTLRVQDGAVECKVKEN